MNYRFLTFFLLTVLLVGCGHPSPKPNEGINLDIADPTKLISASAKGDDSTVKALLSRGIDANECNSQGVTSLMVAARKGHLKVIELLFSAHADPAITDEQGSTALHYAVLGNQPKAIEMLIQHGAPVNLKDGFDLTPLMLATRFASLDVIKILLKSKAKTEAVDENGWSALFFAIPRGDPNVFDAIADQVGEYTALDTDGDGLVATALQYHQPSILKKLVEGHAPVDLPNKRGITPIHMAIESGDVDSLRILVKGIALNQPLSDGRTPLTLAIDLRQKAVAGLLMSLNANPEIKDKNGKSSLDHLREAGLDPDWLPKPAAQ